MGTLRGLRLCGLDQTLSSADDTHFYFSHGFVEEDGFVGECGFLHFADGEGLLFVGVELAGPWSFVGSYS